MKRIILIVLCLIFNLSLAQKGDWTTKYSQRWEKYDGGTKLYVSNDNLLPITYKIGYNPVNLKASKPNGTFIVIPAQSKDVLILDFVKIDATKGWKFEKGNTSIYLGDVTDTDYDEDYVYDLPFEKGTSFKVGQGYNGDISHQDKYAIDFDMPIGTKVYACREGLVIEVVKLNSKNCDKPSCADFNNYVKILHSDGTIMQYLHFKKNGVRVKVGQKVKKGQHIGFSGNVGWSTGPHLHIDLYLTDKNNNYQTLPTKFKTEDNTVTDELKQDAVYLKDY
ncbi:M23 family metallopeptidase [Nonlabens ulvanivorans]|uniref:M23 family metallopeptidase n=1 Tax=Nonlabens ulvanivorans TaxID=906888 RepID=UPI00294347B7|nr:M23 family metallopeptidase [Nonlabens ulvanivorans]WOI22125.1 M23 family metallopeptidase [Nonlabens ulvanivorans]